MSFFPITNAKSNGANFAQRNEKCAEFIGKLTAIRQITSKTNPTVFAVVEIEVPGEPGVFQDYLNFNPTKAEQSMSFLVSHVKQAIQSAGYPVDDAEKDMAWVEKAYNQLIVNKCDVHFAQSRSTRGLNITYLPQEGKSQTPEVNMPPMPAIPEETNWNDITPAF